MIRTPKKPLGSHMTRREVVYLLMGVAVGGAAALSVAAHAVMATAGAGATPAPLGSNVFAWGTLPVEITASGERRAIFDSATATVDRLETHVTTIDVGKASHAAHRHPDEELVFVREGVIEATINGVQHQAPAGSVIFFAANDLHGMRNAGDTRASYFVLRWTSPGRDGPKPGGSR
jgi:quercetin dioxygenase-like cupin family protein